MSERTPRDPEEQDYTGTGTPRSGDMGPPRDARDLDDSPKLTINRSGSGGSGDEQNDEEPPASQG